MSTLRVSDLSRRGHMQHEALVLIWSEPRAEVLGFHL